MYANKLTVFVLVIPLLVVRSHLNHFHSLHRLASAGLGRHLIVAAHAAVLLAADVSVRQSQGFGQLAQVHLQIIQLFVLTAMLTCMYSGMLPRWPNAKSKFWLCRVTREATVDQSWMLRCLESYLHNKEKSLEDLGSIFYPAPTRRAKVTSI